MFPRRRRSPSSSWRRISGRTATRRRWTWGLEVREGLPANAYAKLARCRSVLHATLAAHWFDLRSMLAPGLAWWVTSVPTDVPTHHPPSTAPSLKRFPVTFHHLYPDINVRGRSLKSCGLGRKGVTAELKTLYITARNVTALRNLCSLTVACSRTRIREPRKHALEFSSRGRHVHDICHWSCP